MIAFIIVCAANLIAFILSISLMILLVFATLFRVILTAKEEEEKKKFTTYLDLDAIEQKR